MANKTTTPTGWKQSKLADVISKIQGGGTPSKINPTYWNGKIPWASVKDIVTHNANGTLDHITELGLKNGSTRLVPKGTLIVPTRMALGHAVFFNVDVAINQDLKAIYPSKELKKEFLFYWFQSKKKHIARLGSGSTVDGISQDELKNINYLLPTLPEQDKIVEVLETWDNYLEKLTKTVKLKKKAKKGLMKKLLTGEKRLTNFNDKWELVKLKTICSIQKGKQLNKDNMVTNGTYPALNGGIEASGYTNKWNTKENTITISEGGNSCGYINFNKEKFWCGGHCYAISPSKDIDNLFLYQILKTKQNKIMTLRVGSGLPNIQKKSLDDFKIDIPKSIEEQTAIAEILTTADQEIEALEKKKALIEQQKKFLLNNMITGRLRLPEFTKASNQTP